MMKQKKHNIKLEEGAFSQLLKCEGKIQLETGKNASHSEAIVIMAKKFLEVKNEK